nr:carbonic anhydrase 1-like [Halyomorpha halys]
MMNRVRKKLKPMKNLQEMYKKLMEYYDKKRRKRPVFTCGHVVPATNIPMSRAPVPIPTVRKTLPLKKVSIEDQQRQQSQEEQHGSLVESIYFERRSTMIEKRKGKVDDSPINIDTKIIKKCNYLRLSFQGLFDPERRSIITNSGYHVIGRLVGEVLIYDGPLFGKYLLDNFHVHYGNTCDDGTEHSINGQKYTLELHIVFRPCSSNIDITDKTFNMTAKKVVLGLMFKLTSQPCDYDFFSVVTYIKEKGKTLETSNNLLYDFKDVLSGSDYYNYSGSATEGEHHEYEWMLFKKVLPINICQMQNMWDLRKLQNLKPNVKPPRPLGERSIFTPRYFDHQKCRGKEICDCYGHAFKPITKLKEMPVTINVNSHNK